ncbi:hypothetical protein PtrSN002B_009968 [Pyrenophora tritici-repentis]|uniref:DUF3984 domain containing protein n=2 Tax=Pyrenophora tritici-repentis TaxID=45151 RepID=A0A2W1G8M8_9PLEO|nr:uncharacterized protein PTRG_09964 [Pyrenophora tritici-repentis Pt-1C-BFP]KAA8621653.1 DUF3984 domain-containing protein [Pyrenophora tritici-repentis]EDU43015.1 predicted protein [Pyrenophora tritici-repentis Pt-1C-BFP]KAF7450883.1 DUF3984 domain containing protein [Pyrenophora tritici-repentis]KAF7573548.1 DUF3984 domain containing protein [Pyrenophora tritici-repentis]KAG9380904.1 DUF3984 domain containing protein [Pyrenophora tritici-repentis]
MLAQNVLFALVATVAAVPLNINLGAYSPALVVGDGEISLGSTASASELMATLASGAAAGGGGARPAAAEAAAAAPPAKRANLRRAIEDILGKRANAPIAKREPVESKMDAVEEAMQWIKRDLAGFNAALGYAKEALKDQPKVEMGTENAGVGIIVNPGVNVPAGSAAAGGGEKKEKRDEVVEEEDAPKMTLVAITEV